MHGRLRHPHGFRYLALRHSVVRHIDYQLFPLFPVQVSPIDVQRPGVIALLFFRHAATQ